MAKRSKSEERRLAIQSEVLPEDIPAAEPNGDPVKLRMLQNHFVAGVLRKAGEIIELPADVAARELKLTKGIYTLGIDTAE